MRAGGSADEDRTSPLIILKTLSRVTHLSLKVLSAYCSLKSNCDSGMSFPDLNNDASPKYMQICYCDIWSSFQET